MSSTPNKIAMVSNSTSPAEMRKSYDDGRLRRQDIDGDPMVQFQRWFDSAIRAATVDGSPDWLEPNAMTLSTSAGDRVSNRIVLLKGIEATRCRLTFYSNYTSNKAVQIESNPIVALCFYWPHQQRQVRVEGTAARSDRERSVAYFRSRPRESQLGACVSEQSQPVESREVLERELSEWELRYQDHEVPCPEDWGGYDVTVDQIEFWQGRSGRLHDRIQYRRGPDNQWIIERLAP